VRGLNGRGTGTNAKGSGRPGRRGAWRRPGWPGLVAIALATFGVASAGQAAWIHAKARVGQFLIEQAWERQRHQQAKGGESESGTARPWPGADTWPVARLQAPAHDVDLFVLAGGTGRTLAWGPGHLAGTALPGGPGNAVVAGHRDTHFAFLRELEVGEELVAEDGTGIRRSYRVREAFVTHERDTAVVDESYAEPRLTLVTCWPFDAPVPGGPERYVVVAEGGP